MVFQREGHAAPVGHASGGGAAKEQAAAGGGGAVALVTLAGADGNGGSGAAGGGVDGADSDVPRDAPQSIAGWVATEVNP